MEQNGDRSRTTFAANLITPRSIVIFLAGFALALFLARTLPDVGLFHPEGRIVTLDTVITGSNAPEAGGLHAIATEGNKSFGVTDAVWDGFLLDQVMERAPGPMNIPARIVYVVPDEGPETVIRIEQPD